MASDKAMRVFSVSLVGILLFVGMQASTTAKEGICSLTDDEFLQRLSTMKDWPTIYSVFKRNVPACPDDGFYAEGYTDVVVVALAARWADLPLLDSLLVQDAEFKRFILRHVNASADENDLRRVLHNTETKCPAKYERLCAEIRAQAMKAMADLK
jgi:hypothetical protein